MAEFVDRIKARLTLEEPMRGDLRLAAVAMIIKDPEDPSVLLIKRAERSGDPWSGQVALPGGKMAEEDGSAVRTAQRETLEEVGIDLGRYAEFLGYSEKARTHTGTMEVVPCAFLLKEEVEIVPNVEVASHAWVRLTSMLSPEAKSSHRPGELNPFRMPAYDVGGYTVWGLTYRILSNILPAG